MIVLLLFLLYVACFGSGVVVGILAACDAEDERLNEEETNHEG